MIRPLFFRLPAETAHYAAMSLFVRLASVPGVLNQLDRQFCVSDPRLGVTKFGVPFKNPVGLAAGFDKAGLWYDPLTSLGFGSIEIGTITGQAQPGNPKPRLFRLPLDQALINRLGFNSDGCQVAANNLRNSLPNRRTDGVLGINIGKSKVIALEAAPAEYQKSFEALFPYADYFTINLSSPNTPGLRKLQGRENLIAIIEAVNQSNLKMAEITRTSTKPVLLKIAPDLSDEQIEEIAGVALDCRLNGIVATNTTVNRSNLKTSEKAIERIGNGGLSGRPLTLRSRQVVSLLFNRLRGEIPIVGVGGIMNGPDAWKMITSGADLIQLYTGFVYGGPTLIRDINLYILEQLQKLCLADISAAVGLDHSK